MTPVSAFAAGAAAIACILIPLLWWQRRLLRRADAAEWASQVEAEFWREILAAAPDGLLVWDHAGGAEICSRRLAVLLGLPAGTNSRYADVIAHFEGASRDSLEKGIAALRAQGTAFDLILPVDAGRRWVSAVGVRAGAEDGRPMADILWMRDVSRAGSPAEAAPYNAPEAAREPLYALLDLLPMPVWLRDEEQGVVFANKAGAGADMAEPTRDLARRAREESRAVAEKRLLTNGGAPQLLEVTESPLDGWSGTVGFAVDHTTGEEKEGEHARHAAARDKVLEGLATAIAIYGSDTRLKFFNSAFAGLWRLEDGWLATEPDLGEVLERLREQRRLPEFADFRAFREEQLAQFRTLKAPSQTLLHLPDGATVRATASPYALGGIVCTYEDVTDRLALERSINTLAAVQGATLDNLFEGIGVFGSDGRLKLSNPAFDTFWELDGWTPENAPHITGFVEMMGPLMVGEEGLSDAGWSTRKDAVAARLMGREPSSGRLQRGDGTVLDYANVPLPDGAMMLSYLDVTDSARVEHALRQRAEAYQEADRLKSEFIANVSFEVRTPLNSILGFAEILTGGQFGDLSERQMEYGRNILEASETLKSVVDDILDLATIEAGMMTLELDSVDLHTMLASVLNLIRERARRKSLSLELDCAPDIGWIVADEKRLKQVVFNLLSNSVKFTPPRGVIRLGVARNAESVQISVGDTGPGIPPADRERVVRAFEKGSGQSGQGGAGLGLSLVERFIQLHGGHVEIKSAKNKGTRVICTLPADPRV